MNASGRKSRPSWASRAKIGMKESGDDEQREEARAPHLLDRPISDLLVVPCAPGRFPRSELLCAFSTTTTTASTSAPIATAIPPSDMMFELMPEERTSG